MIVFGGEDRPHLLLEQVGAVEAPLDELLPGILALLALSSGIGPGFTVLFELQSGLVERLRVTPTARLALLAGPTLANVAAMFVFDTISVAVAVAVGYRVHVGIVVLAVLAGLFAASVSAFSMALALSSGGEIQGFAAVINGLDLPVLLLGGHLDGDARRAVTPVRRRGRRAR